MGHEIVICENCTDGDAAEGAALITALGILPDGFALHRVGCMTMCGEPVSVAFRAPGKATYLFSGVRAADHDDLLAFAALFAAAPDGWIDDARPAGRLRLCLKGRIPV